MAILKGTEISGRMKLKDYGLDFTNSDRKVGTNPEIKLMGGQFIDTATANKILFKDSSGNVIHTMSSTYGNTDAVNTMLSLKGTVALASFPHNVITATSQAAGYAKVYDLSAAAYLPFATCSSGAGYAANYQLFPDTEAIGDYAIFGAAAPFGAMWTNVSATVATYSADSITWQYWNGTAWADLTILWDVTDSTANDGKRPFQVDGYTLWSAPTDWAASTIDSQLAYWIRIYVDAAGVTQIPLLDSVEHSILTCPTASEVPIGGVVGRGRFSWTTVSGANANTTCILYNMTSGAASAVKTLTKATIEQEVADFALTVAKDDKLVVFYCAEDGTTEFANGTLELRIAQS